MRMQTYVILVFCMCLVGYLMGYQSGLQGLWNAQNGQISPQTVITSILQYIVSGNNLVLTILGVVIGIVAILSGFSAMFIVPILILLAVLNYYIFPTSFFIDSSCQTVPTTSPCAPTEFSLPLQVILNILTILAIVDFVRGGS